MIFPTYDPPATSATGIIGLLIGVLVFFFIFVWILMLPFIIYLLPRKFNPKFSNATTYFMAFGNFFKSNCYALGIAAPKWLINKKSLLGCTFKDYNLWEDATRFERIVARISFYSSVFALLAMLLFLVHYLIYCFRIWIIAIK
ncbi:MAG: hypothetical protein JSR33_04050 [Proteobacteria bacterium]|nr:hypothetical protein [Pseudomonadota bacterium]